VVRADSVQAVIAKHMAVYMMLFVDRRIERQYSQNSNTKLTGQQKGNVACCQRFV